MDDVDVKKIETMSALLENYNKACNAYLSVFCCLTELSNDGWVGGQPGGISQAGDYFICMADLIVAVENKLSLDDFLEWYDYGCIIGTGAPNLKSWVAGCPRFRPDELTRSGALYTQVGGSHYKKMKIQPIEYILANDIGFVEGAVIKYVSRWKSKNGVEDLKKARHLLDILIESKGDNKAEDIEEPSKDSELTWILQ